MDNGEQKRVGTLVVFVDDGIAADEPLLALPINLSLLLTLPDDKAFVGFTSSTGRFFEKHDLLSWYWCDQQPCMEKDKSTFDYFQQSKFATAARLQSFSPGKGMPAYPRSTPTIPALLTSRRVRRGRQLRVSVEEPQPRYICLECSRGALLDVEVGCTSYHIAHQLEASTHSARACLSGLTGCPRRAGCRCRPTRCSRAGCRCRPTRCSSRVGSPARR